MDLVYICRPGDNEELRYSIRSVVKNFPNHKIWVVGSKPDWYIGDFIPVEYKAQNKYSIARNNLKHIFLSKDISEEFILMNDDFYIINKIDSIPMMYGGTLREKIDSRLEQDGYSGMLEATYSWIRRVLQIQDPLDYELHVPMPMTKLGLKRSLLSPGLWRSVYGNKYAEQGIKIRDVKVYGPGPLEYLSYDMSNLEYDYLSSDDSSFEQLKSNILENMFPDKSQYEK